MERPASVFSLFPVFLALTLCPSRSFLLLPPGFRDTLEASTCARSFRVMLLIHIDCTSTLIFRHGLKKKRATTSTRLWLLNHAGTAGVEFHERDSVSCADRADVASPGCREHMRGQPAQCTHGDRSLGLAWRKRSRCQVWWCFVFFALWRCHLGTVRLRRNLLVSDARVCVALGSLGAEG